MDESVVLALLVGVGVASDGSGRSPNEVEDQGRNAMSERCIAVSKERAGSAVQSERVRIGRVF